jgi:ankyrin repeat protein
MSFQTAFNKKSAAANFPDNGLNGPQDYENRSLLHLAAGKNDTEEVARLLRLGCNPNQPDKEGRTPLFDAVLASAYDVIPLLVAGGADFTERNYNRQTPFDAAIAQGQNAEQLARLIELGAPVNSGDGRGTAMHSAARANKPDAIRFLASLGLSMDDTDHDNATPLHVAVVYGAEDAVHTLLSGGCQPNPVDNSGDTPFYLAVDENMEEMVELMLTFPQIAENADRFISDFRFFTPLMAATHRGRHRLMRILLDNGCSPNRVDSSDKNCAYLAVENNDAQALLILIEHGADTGRARPASRNRVPMIHYPAEHGGIRIFDILAEAGADIDARDAFQKTALHKAATMPIADHIRQILARKPDINAVCESGHRPLDLLMHQNGENDNEPYDEDRAAAIMLLLDAGADVNASPAGTVDEAPLYYAILRDNPEIVAKMLQNKADPNVGRKATPGLPALSSLQLCAIRGKSSSCPLLAAAGADIGIIGNDQRTLLHLCARWGNTAMAQWLVDSYPDIIDIDAADSNGQTALHLACDFGHTDVACLLVAAGANLLVEDADGFNGIHHAAMSKMNELIPRMHLAAGGEIDWNIPHAVTGETPLHLAAHERKQGPIEDLIALGADLTALNAEGYMPLHNAILANEASVMALLAREMKNKDIALNDITISDGWTFLHLAAGQSNHMMTAIMVVHGFDVNAQKDNGDTALHIAAGCGHTRTVEFLLNNKKTNIHIKNHAGRTALDTARKVSQTATAAILEKRMSGQTAPPAPAAKPRLP